MPLVRVTMIKGKSPDYIKKMSDSIYEALVEAYQMTENEMFQIADSLSRADPSLRSVSLRDQRVSRSGRFHDHQRRVRRSAPG